MRCLFSIKRKEKELKMKIVNKWNNHIDSDEVTHMNLKIQLNQKSV